MSGNSFNFNELSNEQRRQFVDAKQLFESYQKSSSMLSRRYEGSMRWLSRKGRDYLHRKRGSTETSLGPRNAETEAQYEAFQSGRTKKRKEAQNLAERLDKMAPVNRALGLGRMPKITARILRQLDQETLLGRHVLVVGTNALFAYEAAAGLHYPSDLLATADADLLWDVRQGMTLLSPKVRRERLLGQLQKVDRSFQLRGKRDFRAYNADGFLVDLIRPEDKIFHQTLHREAMRSTLGEEPNDLHGTPIFGLQWLINAQRFEAIGIGEDGYPLRIATVDPRAFALHKAWISQQEQRDPVKRPRDLAQARATAILAQSHLGLPFADRDLQALPSKLRALVSHIDTPDVQNSEIPEPQW